MTDRLKFLTKFKETMLSSTTRTYESGQIITNKESKELFIYVIEKGAVKVSDSTSSGRARTLLILNKGEAFPLIWAFDHPESVVYTYEALGEVAILSASLSEFKEILKTDPEFTKSSLEMFVNLSWDAMERLKGMQMPFTYERLLSVLPYICAKVGNKVSGQRFRIPKKFSQQEMADLLGVTRESVSSQYQKALKNEVIIDKDGIRLLDLSKIPSEYIFSTWFKT